MTIDGTRIAEEILMRTAQRAQRLPRPPKVAIIAASETPATRSYLAVKRRRAADAGCAFSIISLAEAASTVELRLAVDATDADALIVQLPLPEGVDTKAVCDALALSKDADVLSIGARVRFEADEPDALIPPVAGALAEILRSARVDPRGKRAVVVGQGWLVGRPCATWLAHAGAQVLHLGAETADLSALKAADIVVCGAGAPHFVKSEMLTAGAVLVDAGTSESSGRIVGDADPACAAVCSVFTPVPGGVGPIAVAKLFENAVFLAERNLSF